MDKAKEIVACAHKKLLLDRNGESIGMHISDADKNIHGEITSSLAQFGNFSNSVYATNCPRVKKALEICGYEVIDTARIDGIERFCWC